MDLNNFSSHYTKIINRYVGVLKSNILTGKLLPVSNIRKEIELATRNGETYYSQGTSSL